MGYDIIYKREFLKVNYKGEERVLPLVQSSTNYKGLIGPQKVKERGEKKKKKCKGSEFI